MYDLHKTNNSVLRMGEKQRLLIVIGAFSAVKKMQ